MRRPEKWFPLKVWVCESCWLVQTEIYSRSAELFNDEYAYFSSTSQSWLDHAQNYVKMARDRFALTSESFVVEIASNDGYLLQYVQREGIGCLGIEPTASTAQASIAKGIPTKQEFFGRDLALSIVDSHGHPDLVVANNVIAHVPDIDDFIQGIRVLLEKGGMATLEFPNLLNLTEGNQFDTIYHEHFQYYSLFSLNSILKKNGLLAIDVEELSTHGGSLRVYVRINTSSQVVSPRLKRMLKLEKSRGVFTRHFYEGFGRRAERFKNDFLRFLLDSNSQGHKVVGYGAAAKANTLLNWAGVKSDLISYFVDNNPAKQGKLLPGSRIEIYSPRHLELDSPDLILIFPWNIKEEILAALEPDMQNRAHVINSAIQK